MKIKVNTANYTPFKYSAYLDSRDNSIPKPKDEIYEVGDVVVTNEDGLGKFDLAVVLGCIGGGELRTDGCGMITMERVRLATIADFDNPNISCCEKLRKECMGYKVKYDWKTGKLTIGRKPKEILKKEK